MHPGWQKNALLSKYSGHVVELRTGHHSQTKHRRMFIYIQMIQHRPAHYFHRFSRRSHCTTAGFKGRENSDE